MNDLVVTIERGASSFYEEILGDYVVSFTAKLLKYDGENKTEIGSAQMILTDEKWLKEKGNMSFREHVNFDFNYETNWNETTVYEYLQDTVFLPLYCTKYGETGGTHGKLARILKIAIKESERGNGYFSLFFSKMLNFLEKFDVDFIAVMPSPFGKTFTGEDDTKEKREKYKKEGGKRLQNFYATFGFSLCDNEGIPYMVKRF